MMKDSRTISNLFSIGKSFVVLAAASLLALACTAFAANSAYALSEEYSWDVTYTADKQIVSDYNEASVNHALANMQPGDSFTLHAALNNESSENADWYMVSSALRTLEETQKAAEKAGGAYKYTLSFNGQEIYSSNKVGGDGSELGFKEISGATGSWFLLGTIASGEKGQVAIRMELDGETQGNAYMKTNGELQIAFAVEDSTGASAHEDVPAGNGTTDEGSNLPKTDDVVMIALYSAGIIAALVCLGVCLNSIRKLRKGRDAR